MPVGTLRIGTVPELETQISLVDAEHGKLSNTAERKGPEVKRQVPRIVGSHRHPTAAGRYIAGTVGNDVDRHPHAEHAVPVTADGATFGIAQHDAEKKPGKPGNRGPALDAHGGDSNRGQGASQAWHSGARAEASGRGSRAGGPASPRALGPDGRPARSRDRALQSRRKGLAGRNPQTVSANPPVASATAVAAQAVAENAGLPFCGTSMGTNISSG